MGAGQRIIEGGRLDGGEHRRQRPRRRRHVGVAEGAQVAQDPSVGSHLGLAAQTGRHVPGGARVDAVLVGGDARQRLRHRAAVGGAEPDDLS